MIMWTFLAFNFRELALNFDILNVFITPQLERDKGQQQEGPEVLRVKERLRRTTVLDSGEKTQSGVRLGQKGD